MKQALRQAPGLGRGRPHSEAALVAGAMDLPPTLAAMRDLRHVLVRAVSLEWALGNLDNLRAEQQEDHQPQGQHPAWHSKHD
mmetsp:Transcript_12036/g.30702  ORF Transcript_12036/g.30702 Transcript_12036/m.30702 type:complete len:82 (-) Transcript_12036:227-472(-)